MKNNALHEFIKEKRKQLKLTQKQLGRAVGVSHVTISQWESGLTSPKGRYLGHLAKALNIGMEELSNADLGAPGGTGFMPGQLPMLSWAALSEGAQLDALLEQASTYSLINSDSGPRTFALKMQGDSMVSFNGGKSIPDGAILVANADTKAEHGQVVVALIDDGQALTIKQLVIDGGHTYLKPFNQSYPTREVEGKLTILAVVQKVIQTL